MPSYTFINRKTGERLDTICSVAEREQFLINNPDFHQPPVCPAIGDSIRLGVTKTSDGFQELLKNAKRYHKDNTINTRT